MSYPARLGSRLYSSELAAYLTADSQTALAIGSRPDEYCRALLNALEDVSQISDDIFPCVKAGTIREICRAAEGGLIRVYESISGRLGLQTRRAVDES